MPAPQNATAYAGAPATEGHGAYIVFDTSAFVALMTTVGGFTQSREVLDITHLLTASYRQRKPAELVDPGEFSLAYFSDVEDLQPPISSDAEEVTIYMPYSGTGINLGEYSGTGISVAYVSGQGFFREWSSPELVSGQLMVGSGVIVWEGGANAPTFTAEDNTP